ncbi:MAG: hypothetical protein Aurels2KO_10330 [Aureliella sp.]
MPKQKSELEKKTETKLAETTTMDSVSVMVADDILAADRLRAVPVTTHEWQANSQAFVCEMSADERDQFETDWVDYKQSLGDEENNVGFRAFAVAWCLCNKERHRLFEGREPIAAQSIGKKSGKATARLFNTISRVNGLTKADIDALEKN